MTNSDWISLGSAIVTFLGVVVAAVAIWIQMRKLNEQLMLQHFADYTKRYQEIILKFPENINEANFVLASNKEASCIMRQMRAYFDLCFEEWYLNNRKLLDKEIWILWKSGMEAAILKPAFKQAWAQIKKDSKFGLEFEQYIESFSEKIA